MDQWCTIESDPGVFTELIENIGVKGVQVEEVYMLDKAVLEELRPLYGLIFLFKYEFEHKDTRVACNPQHVFFAEQVIPNACATQAILSVLLNARGIDLGSELTEFKEITADCPPELKGVAIGNSEQIRKVHNSFARPEPFSFSSKKVEKDDDVYHFISYVPVGGVLYELDGLKSGPIDLGQCTDENWPEKVVAALKERIATYTNEIRFVLLALVKNRKEIYQTQLAELRQKKATLEAKHGSDAMDVDGRDDGSELRVVTDKIEQVQGFIANEEAKFSNWKAENIRRKHNYIPFLFHLLKTLAEKDLLLPLVERAKEKQKEREEKKEKEKQEKQNTS